MLFEFECTSLSQSLKLAIHIWTGFIHCGKMLYFSILSWVLHCFHLILEAPSVKLLICKACLTTLNTIPAQHCCSSVKKVPPSDCSEMCIPLLDFTVPWTDKTLAKYCCLLIWKKSTGLQWPEHLGLNRKSLFFWMHGCSEIIN